MEDSDENSEGYVNLNKDKRTRKKIDKFKKQVGKLVKMISDDANYGSRSWDKRIESVKEAIKLLNNPQFVLKRLISIMKNMTFSHDVRKVESALQELQSFLEQSKNIVLNQDSAKETDEFSVDHIPLDGNEDPRMEDLVKELQKEMEESTSFGEELKEIIAMLEQKHQSLTKALVYTRVANFLQKVVDSCMEIAKNDILSQNCAPQVEGHRGVEIQGEQLRLSFSQTPDSIQICEKGENVEVHNPEMSVQDKHGKEVVLTLRSEAGRLAELKLAKKITNQEKGFLEENSTNEWLYDLFKDSSPLEFGLMSESCPVKDGTAMKSDEGTSNDAANEANLKLSPDEISYKDNANVLDEIFQEHPNIIDNLQLSSQHLQDYFMTLLAQIYQKIIKSNPEMLKLEDIKSMEAIVRDMEHNGLQVSWLQEKLAKSRKKLETQEARSKILKRINSHKAETEGTEQEQTHSAKKGRVGQYL